MKKIRRFTALLLSLAMVLSLSACSKGETQETPESRAEAAESTESKTDTAAKTVTDMVGRSVEIIPGSYKRVVCIGAGALRMYSYICDISLLAGLEDIDNLTLEERPAMFDSAARPYVLAYSEEFSKLPSCGVGGPNAQTADAEHILSCDPDIVISEYEDADKENALQEQLGVPVITLKSGSKGIFAEEFTASMQLLGEVFDVQDRADKLLSFIDEELSEITKRTKDVAEDDKPSVYISGLGNWGTTNHLMTSETYPAFAAANIKNAVTGLGIQGMGEIEEEKFASLGENMDIMIIDAAAVKNIRPLFAEDPAMFDTCKAWQDGEVYLEMAYNSYYTNYEISLANAWFAAKTVYPDLFKDIDMKDKTNEITKAFLGKELADEIFACGASFGGYQKIDTENFFK